MADTKISDLTELLAVSADDLFVIVDDPSGTPETKKITVENLTIGGWIPAGETWTYASANDPEFTFTISGDKTSKYWPGMRLKLDQSGEKFFIVTAVSYSDPDTTVTIYGGTDYDLANAAIASPAYSREKAPLGFPLSPDLWSVIVNDTTARTQTNPVDGTWYNLGSLSINIPTGVWEVSYQAPLLLQDVANTSLYGLASLSTANNSESDKEFTVTLAINAAFAHRVNVTKRKILELAAMDTYYFIAQSSSSSIDTLSITNSVATFLLKAKCAYL